MPLASPPPLPLGTLLGHFSPVHLATCLLPRTSCREGRCAWGNLIGFSGEGGGGGTHQQWTIMDLKIERSERREGGREGRCLPGTGRPPPTWGPRGVAATQPRVRPGNQEGGEGLGRQVPPKMETVPSQALEAGDLAAPGVPQEAVVSSMPRTGPVPGGPCGWPGAPPGESHVRTLYGVSP